MQGDVLGHLLQFLPVQQLAQASLVCHAWYQESSQDRFVVSILQRKNCPITRTQLYLPAHTTNVTFSWRSVYNFLCQEVQARKHEYQTVEMDYEMFGCEEEYISPEIQRPQQKSDQVAGFETHPTDVYFEFVTSVPLARACDSLEQAEVNFHMALQTAAPLQEQFVTGAWHRAAKFFKLKLKYNKEICKIRIYHCIHDREWFPLYCGYLNKIRYNNDSPTVCKMLYRKQQPALRAYYMYLYLVAKYPHQAKHPTYLIDLVWHAHMCHPVHYAKDCEHYLHGALGHQPWPETLNAECDSLWQQEYKTCARRIEIRIKHQKGYSFLPKSNFNFVKT